MKELKKCKKCGLFIDKNRNKCPFCGFDQDINNEENNNSPKNSIDLQYLSRSKGLSLSFLKEVILFLSGTIGLIIIQLLIIGIINLSQGSDFLQTVKANSIITIATYSILFPIMLLVLYKDNIKLLIDFKNAKLNIIWGILSGVIIILISTLYNYLIDLGGFNQNDNQQSVENIIDYFPVASVFIIGLIGPICEELTYRLGFFALLKKINKYLAYVLAAVFFGFIHFNYSSKNLLNELINLPNYIFAGVALCFTYDKFGLPASISAHVFNNIVGLIQMFILKYYA